MARARVNGDANEVNWEIAWQICDEVNSAWGNFPLFEVRPLDHFCDLSCLQLEEARVILTQKLVELAEHARAFKAANQ